VDILGFSEFWEKRGAAFGGGDRGPKIGEKSELFLRRKKRKTLRRFEKLLLVFLADSINDSL
jgi:hypothetical protein